MRLLYRNIGELEQRCEETYAQVHPSNAQRSIPGTGQTLAPLLIGALTT